MVSDKPQLEFLYQLNKINGIYDSYDDIETKEDIANLIHYHERKENYSKEELERLQLKCISEWNDLLLIICNTIIKKVGKNKSKKKIFAKELEESKDLIQKLNNNNLRLEDFERIYNESLQKIKRDFDSKWEKQHIEWKRFWIGLFAGFILGMIGGYILFSLGYA